jgi:hypothetical protein
LRSASGISASFADLALAAGLTRAATARFSALISPGALLHRFLLLGRVKRRTALVVFRADVVAAMTDS